MLKTAELYDMSHTLAGAYLSGFEYPWQALKGIKELILALGPTLGEDYTEVSPTVWVHKTAAVAPTAFLGAPCIIGAGTEVRHCAFIRGSALVGEGCVVGNSVELKNAILFDNVQVPHFNYVGDSILGYKSHMGAGSVTSNVKSDKTLVVVKNGEEQVPTGLKKFGAMSGAWFPPTASGKPAELLSPKNNVFGTFPGHQKVKGVHFHGQIFWNRRLPGRSQLQSYS